jgi:hypothetical protein
MDTAKNANLQNLQALVQSEAVKSWAETLRRSKKNTWQRDEAKTGLRAAANLAVGIKKTVTVEVAAPLRDTRIVVDGHAFAIWFIGA